VSASLFKNVEVKSIKHLGKRIVYTASKNNRQIVMPFKGGAPVKTFDLPRTRRKCSLSDGRLIGTSLLLISSRA
jgi:hypothetical protein